MRNILFDFDGTLFDTDAAHEAAYQNVWRDHNLGRFESYEEIKGVRTIDVFKRFTDQETAVVLAQKKTAEYLDSLPVIRCLVDLSLLDACKQLGYRLYIVSGGSSKSIFGLLDLHNAKHLFDGIVTSGDYSESKPSPESFLFCIEKYRIEGELIGVEDSEAGIESLKRASVFAVGVHNEKIRATADLYYSDINMFLKEVIINEQS